MVRRKWRCRRARDARRRGCVVAGGGEVVPWDLLKSGICPDLVRIPSLLLSETAPRGEPKEENNRWMTRGRSWRKVAEED